MEDPFKNQAPSLTAPASHGEAITPSDTAGLSTPTRAIYIGSGGDLAVEMLGGQMLTFRSMQGGVFYPLRVVKVFATGTTATDIVGIS